MTDKRWLIAVRQKDQGVKVEESSYDSTLLVELTIILLHGQVKIDFVDCRSYFRLISSKRYLI
jgi:hypothetical protein